jgi:hypothetical protein
MLENAESNNQKQIKTVMDFKKSMNKFIYKYMISGDDPRLKNLSERSLTQKIKEQPSMRKCEEFIEHQEILTNFVLEHFNTYKYDLRGNCKLLIDLLKQEELLD